jgi:6-phosphogluconolactonase
VQWDRAEFFWGDERMVPSEHPDSSFQMANKALLSRIPVPQRNIHRIPTERGEPETVARKYEEEIAEVFRVRAGGQPPAFDLVLLGMGTDGHTASLFPNTDALNEASRWVAPNRGPLPHVDRVTMTARILNAARHVIFLVVGADKADILAQVLEGPRDFRRLPSQMICPASGDVMWFVDSAAASKLRQTEASERPHGWSRG